MGKAILKTLNPEARMLIISFSLFNSPKVNKELINKEKGLTLINIKGTIDE